jgi:histidyl-tRNA synthetase
MSLINPRTLKGFRDFLPQQMRLRNHLMHIIKDTFETYGYEPLATPTLEHADILQGKYGADEKLMYTFKDHGDRPVAMKYDLTVPAARVLAQYQHLLPLPFKRYQLQPVWRADNTQKGRYREFWQCDADCFGTTSTQIEAEWIVMGMEIFSRLNLHDVVISLSHRQLLNAILRHIGSEPAHFGTITTALDKLDKIGWDNLLEHLHQSGITTDTTTRLRTILDVPSHTLDLLQHFRQVFSQDADGLAALADLENVISYATQWEVPLHKIVLNPTIVRGLSYYTGLVWEWQSIDAAIGSLGGGGRYDQLISTFTKQSTPAAGGSLGLERIIDLVQERATLSNPTPPPILIARFDPQADEYLFSIAKSLRSQCLPFLIYPSVIPLDKQLKYADKKDLHYVIFASSPQVQNNTVLIKNLRTSTQIEVNSDGLTPNLFN